MKKSRCFNCGGIFKSGSEKKIHKQKYPNGGCKGMIPINQLEIEEETKEEPKAIRKSPIQKVETLDYKKACEEAIISLDEEFTNGAKAMLNFIQREGTGCLGIKCDCVICKAGNKFLWRLKHGKR